MRDPPQDLLDPDVGRDGVSSTTAACSCLPFPVLPGGRLLRARPTSRKNCRTGSAGDAAPGLARRHIAHHAASGREPGARADRHVVGQPRACRRSAPRRRAPRCPRGRCGRQITQFRPITTLWAIWTRLSILVFSPITVSSKAPRSMQVCAPIVTPSWMITRPSCGTSIRPRGPTASAEAGLADHRAGADRHAIADQREADRRRWRRSGSPAADGDARADDRVGPDLGAGPDLHARRRAPRRGRSTTPSSIIGVGMHGADRRGSSRWPRCKRSAAIAQAACGIGVTRAAHDRQAAAASPSRTTKQAPAARRTPASASVRSPKKATARRIGARQHGGSLDRFVRRAAFAASPRSARPSSPRLTGPRASKNRGSGVSSLRSARVSARRPAGRCAWVSRCSRSKVELSGSARRGRRRPGRRGPSPG